MTRCSEIISNLPIIVASSSSRAGIFDAPSELTPTTAIQVEPEYPTSTQFSIRSVYIEPEYSTLRLSYGHSIDIREISFIN
jgi:hypothetical protein